MQCWEGVLVSISQKCYVQLFCTKVLCAPFLYLHFGFVIFLQKNIGAKAALQNVDEIDYWCQFYPTFYEQFLRAQIPKAQKDHDDLTVFLCF